MSPSTQPDLARRLELVRQHPDLNGVAYLDVVDTESSTKALRQRTLLVHALKDLPVGINGANVRLLGGVRVAVKVLWAARASDLPTGHGVPAAVLNGLGQNERVLVVRTDSTGDFAPYTLELSRSADQFAPLPLFDPLLSRITFSFKVECPSEFDCKQEAAELPGQLAQPLLDYMAKDYQSFRRLMLDRLAVTLPDWKERSPADLGVTLVELLAYAADHLSYYQDAVATEAYLGTARRRVSVRRHARLLDYRMHEGCNSRALIALETASDGVVLKAAETQFLTRCVPHVRVEPAELAQVLDFYQPEVFEPLQDLALYRAHNAIPLYAWSLAPHVLIKGATQATLLDDAANRLRLCAGDLLILEEDGEAGQRHVVRLTGVYPEAVRTGTGGLLRTPSAEVVEDPLTGQRVVEVSWAEADALPFDLPVSDRSGQPLSLARGNVLLADHGQTVKGEPLPAVREGVAPYRPALRRANLTYAVPHEPEGSHAAAQLLSQDPRKARPAVTLVEGDAVWLPQFDLLGSDRFAREFVVETESDGTAFLRFGDGRQGRRPEAGAALTAQYRTANGPSGNVGAESIAHLVSVETAIVRVRNPLPAVGGTAPESMEAVRQYAPVAFRRQERAVTAQDCVAAAERHPEVLRAEATLRWTGSWHTMFVTVERAGERPVDEPFRTELKAFLERFRLAGYDLEVEGPRYVPLDIALEVCVVPGYFWDDVEQALLQQLGRGRLPDGRLGFFHPDHFTFGQPVYLSQLIAAAAAVDGVQSVSLGGRTRFQRWGRGPQGEREAGLIEIGRLEIARLENDPSRPENGKLEIYVRGGL